MIKLLRTLVTLKRKKVKVLIFNKMMSLRLNLGEKYISKKDYNVAFYELL